MKRHPALIPFSHDHHDGLVHARRLRRAAEHDADARRDVVAAFLSFVEQDLEAHFVDEERFVDFVGPLVSEENVGRLAPHVARMEDEHSRIRASWKQLYDGLATDEPVPSEHLTELGDLLHSHIRFEERELFDVLQAVVPDDVLMEAGGEGADDDQDSRSSSDTELRTPQLPADSSTRENGVTAMPGVLRADLKMLGASRRGIPWSAASRDLNVTCLSWEPGHRIEAHRTSDRDIVVIGIDGSGTVTVEGVEQAVEPGTIVLSPAGTERCIEAGPDGFVYVSMHRRREAITLGTLSRS
ncbi:MAG: hemerythrin domain-containing protein [Gaiellales bacterium]